MPKNGEKCLQPKLRKEILHSSFAAKNVSKSWIDDDDVAQKKNVIRQALCIYLVESHISYGSLFKVYKVLRKYCREAIKMSLLQRRKYYYYVVDPSYSNSIAL